MLRVYTTNEKKQWNSIVKSYQNWDVYYLCEYAVAFQLHGDGIPLLISYEEGHDRFCYVVMKRDIAEDKHFINLIESGKYFDFETPYGYGGPLCDCQISETAQQKFLSELKKYALQNGIVSQFARFHPLLANHEALPNVFECRYLHHTIYMDTFDKDSIMTNMDSKNRNMIRKAIKNGVVIVRKPIEDYSWFVPIYEETMNRDNADDYYYFTQTYFREQLKLKDNACIFYAVREKTPIAAAIMYYNERVMHYHLAGSLTEARRYAPGNLLLYEAACWACDQGIKRFHLGGGIVEDDNLFGFKKQFNKNGYLSFYIGRTILNCEAYERLMKIRKEADSDFNMDNNRMIQYRI